MNMTAAVITVSDRCYRGEREDLSGPAVAGVLREAGFVVPEQWLVPDETPPIVEAMQASVRRASLIVTTGGTGISQRDVTPEATMSLCERLLPGIPEVMRFEGLKQTPMAPLSRGVCGVCEETLVINLPGNPKGAAESLRTVMPLLLHALELLSGDTDHSA